MQEFGLSEIRDLKPTGRNIPVTEENKKEYVKLVCQMKMTGAIRKQIDSFLEGFYEIIPKRLISIFDEQELELLISGLPNIDLDDLKANTEYHKYTESSLQVSSSCWGVLNVQGRLLSEKILCLKKNNYVLSHSTKTTKPAVVLYFFIEASSTKSIC